MADESIKIIEAKGGPELQVAVDAWIATLTGGYVIHFFELSQAGASLESDRVILAIAFTDGS